MSVRRSIFWALPLMVLSVTTSPFARVSGPCSNCHTMHNSQDGSNSVAPAVSTGPHEALTRGDCVGCHTGDNQPGDPTPYVLAPSEPEYGTDTLAGGNFWWVADSGDDNDTKGHNVLGISSPDGVLSEAPGSWISCANSCHYSLAVKPEVNPPSVEASPGGCQGCHLKVRHHADDSATIVGSAAGWYRFLAGHMSGEGHGVEGIEDADWEYTRSAGDHNEYFGLVGNHDTNAGFANLGNTMTAYCCGCHGQFHLQGSAGVSPWLRHPSDAVIPDDKEYAAYTVYNPLAPPARPDLEPYESGPSEEVTPGTDLVMCLSCHRAHGTPYPDMLRWDYLECEAGTSSDCGCFVCHTTKDD
jgi:hypothetical protein